VEQEREEMEPEVVELVVIVLHFLVEQNYH
jgi:hypothetical protein